MTMLAIIKFIFFICCLFSFGFIFLKRMVKIKCLVFLLPLSLYVGITVYLLLVHILAFHIGPKSSSIVSLYILFGLSIFIFFQKQKTKEQLIPDISKKQLIVLFTIVLLFAIPTFLMYYEFGIGDKNLNYPLVLTLFHNDIYPPKDFFRPDQNLLYHYVPSLLPGAIHSFCRFPISLSYAIIDTILHMYQSIIITFIVALILTRNFKLSLACAIINYLGGNLVWLDTIVRYLTNNLPAYVEERGWGFLEAFSSLGFRGGMIGSSSEGPMSIAVNIGAPIYSLSFFIYWMMVTEKKLSANLLYFFILLISLNVLIMTEESLFIAFWFGAFIYSLHLLLRKQWLQLLLTFLLALSLVISQGLVIHSPLSVFSKEMETHTRKSLYMIKLKENPFKVMSFRHLDDLDTIQYVNFLSWDSLCEFGPRLMFIPFAVFYLIKTRHPLALMSFYAASMGFIISLLFEHPDHPDLLNRFFGFTAVFPFLGLIAIGTLFRSLLLKRTVFMGYFSLCCIIPFIQLILGAIFTLNIWGYYGYMEQGMQYLRKGEFSKYYEFIREETTYLDPVPLRKYKSSLNFLKDNSQSGDVAISSLFEAPVYAGLYTLIPPGIFHLKDSFFSKADNTYDVVFYTLDPHLLHELNIKWIFIDSKFKETITETAKNILSNKNICKLVYKCYNKETNENLEIYHIQNVKKHLKEFNRNTAWILTNDQSQPIEIVLMKQSKITLFPSAKKATSYLNSLLKNHPDLKKEFLIPKAVVVNIVENQIKESGSHISLVKEF